MDRILADEVVNHAIYGSRQLRYQRIDPWIRNTAQKLKRGIFNPSLLTPALKKYLVNDAIDSYMNRKGAFREIDQQTRNIIAEGLSRAIIAEAKKVANMEHPIKYQSDSAKDYMKDLGIW